MTIIGKILTFLVFFMSLVFLGFAYTINQLNHDTKSGQSWVTVAKKLRDEEIPKLQKDVEAKDKVTIDLQAEITKLSKQLDEAKASWVNEVKQARDQAAADRAESEKVKSEFKKNQDAADNALAELAKRREEAIALQESVKKKDLAIADIQSNLTRMTNLKIEAQVAATTYLDRVKSLEKQNQELVRAMEDERQKVAEKAAIGGGQELVRRPPPDDVRGSVKSVTNEGLLSINIGSDHGLLRGHTLEVFRTEPKAQYLGVMQIVEVGTHEAVGKLLTPQYKKLVQPNDQVASRILPSR